MEMWSSKDTFPYISSDNTKKLSETEAISFNSSFEKV